MTRHGKVSIRDVAAAAGVSPTTVSQVLNDRDAERFTAETIEAVRSAAANLGYSPHPLARSLIRGCTESIGLMVSGLQNPFFVELLECAIQTVLDAGYAPILNCGPSCDGTYAHHSRINEWLVDGVLMWSEGNERIQDYFSGASSRTPVCYLSSNDREDDCDLIELDLTEGARILARHIIEKGYRNVAYVTPYSRSDLHAHSKRQIGFSEVFYEAGIPFSTIHFPTPGPTRARGREAGLAIASMPAARRPDALLCHNDITAVGLINGLRRAGVIVPNGIAVAGFDGIDEGRWYDKTLTTMEIPLDEVCKTGIEWLIDRINGYKGPRRKRMVLPRLRIGETT